MLSSLVYSRENLDTAIAAYSGLCLVTLLAESPIGCQVEIQAAPGIGDEVRVTHEFLNYLLDVSLEVHLKER